jgi:predicted MFS family arabinose efflux permease
VVLAIMVFNRDALDDRAESAGAAAKPAAGAIAAPQEHPMAFMKLPSVWLCFSFFFWSTCALSAIQSFASPALQSMYGLPLSVTALIVTGYMLCGAAGMVVGGFLVGRVQRLEKVISICMLGSGLLLFVVGTGWLPGMAAVVVASVAGLGTGLAGPRATC